MLPNLTSLTVSKFTYPDQRILDIEEVLSGLPQALTSLEFESPQIVSAAQASRLLPYLTRARLHTPNLLAIGRALPRGIKYLCVAEVGRATPQIGNLGNLPPNLIEFLLSTQRVINDMDLWDLPSTLRFCHIPTVELSRMPPNLSGISGSLGSWIMNVAFGSDPKQGHRDMDVIRQCMTKLPPGCLCSATLTRGGDIMNP
jgi:hypothetical protein